MNYNSSFITVDEHNKKERILQAKLNVANKKQQKEAEKLQKEAEKLQKEFIKKNKKESKIIKEQKNLKKEKTKKIESNPEFEPEVVNNQINTITEKLTYMIEDNKVNMYFKPLFQILKSSDIVIDKIIHIADIHIRLSKLHLEYNQVFQNLYNELNLIKTNHPKSIICLCGDLLHSKDELKPDTIIITWNFIKNLSDIFPLFIITGNHDTIELNNDKIDSITAILKDRPIENTYYLLNSGVYIYNNIIFGVSSIIDKFVMSLDVLDNILIENNFTNHIKNSNYKKIGMYHGSVDGAVNDLGIRIRGNKKLKDFAASDGTTYDYILLGDIHKFQYLDKTKRVAYSSSLISQNFGETDDCHGFLEWNILNGDSVYHNVKNDYAYHKISINKLYDNNINENVITLNTQYINDVIGQIKSGFVRILFNDSLIKKINRETLRKQINDLYPNIIISWQLILNKVNNNIDDNIIDVKIDDTKSITTNNVNKDLFNQNSMDELIKKFIKLRYYGVNDDTINKVLLYLNKIITETQSNDIGIEYVKSDWKLIWLSFDYMYGYGPNNIIDFTKYPINDIVGIFGDNAIGKSSLIDIITYMLFSRSARDESSTNPRDIVNVKSNKANGLLIIESHNTKYMINRIVTRTFSNTTKKYTIRGTLKAYKMIDITDEQNVSTNDCELFTLHDKKYKLISLTEENRLNTDDVLVSIIGTYDNFITTSVILQGNHKSFKSKSNADKKDFLCQILKLDYFKKCDGIIVDKYKSLKNQFNTLNKFLLSLSDKSLQQLNDDVDNFNKQIDEITIEIEKYENITKLNYEKINDFTSQIIKTNFDNDFDFVSHTKSIDNINLQINNVDNQITINNELHKSLNNKLNNLDLIVDQQKITDEYQQYVSKIKLEQSKLMDQLNELIEAKLSLQLIKIPDDVTVQTLNGEISNCNIRISTLIEKKNKILAISDKIYALNDKIVDLNLAIINENQLTDSTKKLNDLNNEFVQLQYSYNELQSKINNINIDINKLSLINNSVDIKNNYHVYLTTAKNQKNELIEIINSLSNSKKTKHIINNFDDESTIKINYELCKSFILYIMSSNSINIDNDILSINSNTDKITINNSYINNLHQQKQFLTNKIDIISKQLYQLNINKSYDQLNSELNNLNLFVTNKNNIAKYKNYINTIYNHNCIITNNQSKLYDTINSLNLSLVNKEYDKCLNLLTDLKLSLEYVLENTEYMNNYNRAVEFVSTFDKYNDDIKEINRNINKISKFNKLNIMCTEIKIHVKNIDTILNSVNLIEKYLTINNGIGDNITSLFDDLTSVLNSIKHNIDADIYNDDINSQINLLQQKIITIDSDPIIDVFNKLSEQNEKYIELDKIRQDYIKEINIINDKIKSINLQINDININIDQYYQNKHILLFNEETNANINSHIDNINSINKNLFKNDIFITGIKNIYLCDVIIDKIVSELNKQNILIENANKNIQNIYDNEKIMNKIVYIDSKIIDIKLQIETLSNNDSNIIKLNNKLLQQISEKNKLDSEIINVKKIIVELNIQKNILTKKKLDLEEISANYEKSKDTIKHNKHIHECIMYIKNDLINISSEIKKLNNRLIVENNNKSSTISIIENFNKTNLELNIIKTELDIYDILSKLTCRDGVQLYLLSESLENITNKVNSILEPFINKTINLSLNNETIELSIYSKNDSIIHTISGMESFMLDLVFKIIIGHISVIPKSNIIFMDESISVLDKHRLASIDELFTFLRQYYNTVFLITHMKQVNNHINNSIEIFKNNDFSSIYNVNVKNTYSDIIVNVVTEKIKNKKILKKNLSVEL
jgi:DNA repair exonuclease SbcCD ATPase subunit